MGASVAEQGSRNRLMAKAYRAGHSIATVGAKFALSDTHVYNILIRLGVKMRPRGIRTEAQREEHRKRAREAWERTAPVLRQAECHPQRRAYVGTLCRWCYQARPTFDDLSPVLVKGLTQHAATTLPDACPKCHAEPPTWVVGEEYAQCRACGQDSFLSSGRVVTLQRADETLKLRNQSAGATRRGGPVGERW